MRVEIQPGWTGREAVVAAPPSKSVAHRAVLCAGLARGASHIRGLASSQDIEATLAAVQQTAAEVKREGDTARIEGRGGFATVLRPVDCAESGSTLRFLIPVLSLTGQRVEFTGRGRLFRRPLSVYQHIFEARRLTFQQTEEGLVIQGAVSAGAYELPGDVSSQFVSGLLFVLPLLERESRLVIRAPFESRSYVELTRGVQARFGICSRWEGEDTLVIPGNQAYKPCDLTVEGDYSQAAFFCVLGALCGGVRITGLAQDSGQGDRVILDILRRCGAAPCWQEDGSLAFEKAEGLAAAEIDLADCPDLGPVLMVLAAFCQGETRIFHAARLRLKESDRIEAMEEELRKWGVSIRSTQDEVFIKGGGLHAPAALGAHNDHRIVMSMAVLALAAGFPAEIHGAQAVAKSWPGFFAALRGIGADIKERDDG